MNEVLVIFLKTLAIMLGVGIGISISIILISLCLRLGQIISRYNSAFN